MCLPSGSRSSRERSSSSPWRSTNSTPGIAMARIRFFLLSLVLAAGAWGADSSRPRVIVSSDIGGTDPDDYQSMAHVLLYADALELEGLISSPYGRGRKQHILEVIDEYERDYANLKT